MNIHIGYSVEDSNILRFERLPISEILDEYLDAFILGYTDRNCEELDDTQYLRVSKVKTILELFYKVGYNSANFDIRLGTLYKSPCEIHNMRETFKVFLDRLNVRSFYEKNS